MSYEVPHDQVTSVEGRDSIDLPNGRRSSDTPLRVQEPALSRTALDGPETRERLNNVLQSDIGVSTLLNRLKQSIASARDFAVFLKKRSTLEEEHAQGLKKLCRATNEFIRRPEHRQESFAQNYEEIIRIHDQMSYHGLKFAMSLHQMSDDLQDLALNIEKGRKHWKQSGLNAEKRVQDSETAMEKSRGKYYTLADQYDRARTGDRQGGRFGLKGPKSAATQEEDLHRKVLGADNDYAAKVQAAQSQRHELLSTLRPQAVKALQELIEECDAGLGLQLQRFASQNEALLLGNGLCVSPLKDQANSGGSEAKSLREIATQIDNDRDFKECLLKFSEKASTRTLEIKYEKHPALASPKLSQSPSHPSPQQTFDAPSPSFSSQNQSPRVPSGSTQTAGITSSQNSQRNGQPIPGQSGSYQSSPVVPSHSQTSHNQNNQAPQLPQLEHLTMSGANKAYPPEEPLWRPNNNVHSDVAPMSSSNRSIVSSITPSVDQGSDTPLGAANYRGGPQPPGANNYRPASGLERGNTFRLDGLAAAPNSHYKIDGPSSGVQNTLRPQGQAPAPGSNYRSEPPLPGPQSMSNHRRDTQPTGPAHSSNQPAPMAANFTQNRRSEVPRANLPPLNPVFGVSLDELFRRDGSAVPMIVYQCIQAVDLFGLDVEGIYRTSGSVPHITEMKSMFDNDSSQVDFRNPAAFHHDIASVTTLLKLFLKDLPDPLFTSVHYNDFITAARIDDGIIRRDSLHAIINSLPDPHYATLRLLVLHLNRVAEKSTINRMTPSNLAICFGPTLMGQPNAGVGTDIRDAGWQTRVIETVLMNTFQIFDDDD